jgi:hypothetical protein
VPEGRLVGKSIKLAPFTAIYDDAHGPTRRAFLSMGRKNAKTTLCACLLLNHLCGPSAEDRPNSQLFSAAQSRDQAALLFGLAAKMVRMQESALDRDRPSPPTTAICSRFCSTTPSPGMIPVRSSDHTRRRLTPTCSLRRPSGSPIPASTIS